jgi:hypothetical protein
LGWTNVKGYDCKSNAIPIFPLTKTKTQPCLLTAKQATRSITIDIIVMIIIALHTNLNHSRNNKETKLGTQNCRGFDILRCMLDFWEKTCKQLGAQVFLRRGSAALSTRKTPSKC